MWYDVFRKVANQKDVDKTIRDAVARGWIYEKLKNNHQRIRWPHCTDRLIDNQVTFPGSISEYRGLRNNQAKIKRIEAAWPKPTEEESTDETKLGSFRVWAERSREDIIDQVKKLHALGNDPSAQPGERQNAIAFRDKLIKQHNITSREFGTFLPDSVKPAPAPTQAKPKKVIDVDKLSTILTKLYGLDQ